MIDKELPNWSVEDIVHQLEYARKALELLEELTGLTKADIIKMEARLNELTTQKQIDNV